MQLQEEDRGSAAAQQCQQVWGGLETISSHKAPKTEERRNREWLDDLNTVFNRSEERDKTHAVNLCYMSVIKAS